MYKRQVCSRGYCNLYPELSFLTVRTISVNVWKVVRHRKINDTLLTFLKSLLLVFSFFRYFDYFDYSYHVKSFLDICHESFLFTFVEWFTENRQGEKRFCTAALKIPLAISIFLNNGSVKSTNSNQINYWKWKKNQTDYVKNQYLKAFIVFQESWNLGQPLTEVDVRVKNDNSG